jgi:hypothetical protein
MDNNPQPEQLRHRLTAEEVRNKYGKWVLGLLVWEIWCIRDGWFNPDPHYEYRSFNHFMAYISAPALAFCLIMTASAMRAIQRRKEHPQPPPDSSPSA